MKRTLHQANHIHNSPLCSCNLNLDRILRNTLYQPRNCSQLVQALKVTALDLAENKTQYNLLIISLH